MPILLDYQNREVRLTEERLAHILAHPTDKNLAEQEPNFGLRHCI
ncbi:hypothetical protein [Leptolyngbya sp. NK1-12]|nr:hypothetical protein [Leptolyngbya sp. NK1-12]